MDPFTQHGMYVAVFKKRTPVGRITAWRIRSIFGLLLHRNPHRSYSLNPFEGVIYGIT